MKEIKEEWMERNKNLVERKKKERKKERNEWINNWKK